MMMPSLGRSVTDSTNMKVLLTDKDGNPVDAAFSVVLLPSVAGPFPYDLDFSLLVLDLSATGSLSTTV